MNTPLETLTNRVCSIAKETGLFLLEEQGKLTNADIRSKGLHDYVTYVDQTSEARIIEKLRNLLPEAGFIAEESPHLERKQLSWVIDPLDGTTNFIHGVPLYCISIALMEGDEVILGVVHEPNAGECFYTWRGAPSFLNGREIRVSATGTVNQSLLATGFPYYDYARLEPYLNLFKYLMQHSHGVRRLGSAAADLAYVACGRYDGFYEYGLRPWDVAAGALLVENAGGKCGDFTGEKNHIFGKEILAMNPAVFYEFVALMKREFV